LLFRCVVGGLLTATATATATTATWGRPLLVLLLLRLLLLQLLLLCRRPGTRTVKSHGEAQLTAQSLATLSRDHAMLVDSFWLDLGVRVVARWGRASVWVVFALPISARLSCYNPGPILAIMLNYSRGEVFSTKRPAAILTGFRSFALF
jgi:hypothetical protein